MSKGFLAKTAVHELRRNAARARGLRANRRQACMMFLALASIGFFVIASALPTFANPPRDESPAGTPDLQDPAASRASRKAAQALHKTTDAPNPRDYRAAQKRRALIEKADQLAAGKQKPDPSIQAELSALARQGTDRVLVILVEFGGSDTFRWDPAVDVWDPIGMCDGSEYTGNPGDIGTTAATANLITKYNLTTARDFVYQGPLHNQIERPLSAEDRSGDSIWTEDFNPSFYHDIIAGNGVRFAYNRQDGSTVDVDFTGKSVRDYLEDMSGGKYTFTADVIGWLQVPHSTWWYGADYAPGARSGYSAPNNGAIPGAGNSKSLVRDALDALNAVSNTIPGFNWANYDQDGDGIIDRLWIIHAGLGEEDSTVMLNRTTYGEAALWSHSSAVSPPYVVTAPEAPVEIAAGPYIMMPENCGIGVLAHEYSHNLGADDLYAYDLGETSAGFWTIMCDDWTGYPIGFEPPAHDPWHLDNWGWLDPFVASDPSQVYTVKIGQASAFPGGADVYRGVRIPLPDQAEPNSVRPNGNYYWYSGAADLTYGGMQTQNPVAIPAGGATLQFQAAWDIEDTWDFLWVQASADSGATWATLTNDHTSGYHDPGWIGGNFGFPDDLEAAGIGGFTGTSGAYPNLQTETFDLGAFAGQQILLRIWYMTDWGTVWEGAFVDDIAILDGSTPIFSDDAETDNSNWNYSAPWSRNDGVWRNSHNYYLQWRNTSATGGYDSCLGEARWRYGPANSGLLVWYNNNKYTDNEIFHYLTDSPGFGPKGRMLVVDAHPQPYRDPYWTGEGYENEGANVAHRSLMRDAPFSRNPCVDFTMPAGYVYDPATVFRGYPAAPRFSDFQTWYPGSEYVLRGPGYFPPPYLWLTRQWDASAVLPAAVDYGVRAPGYQGNQRFAFNGRRSGTGLLSVYSYPSGLGYNGSAGNPGDHGGHYGWNVEVLEQTDTVATVKIWNSRFTSSPSSVWGLN